LFVQSSYRVLPEHTRLGVDTHRAVDAARVTRPEVSLHDLVLANDVSATLRRVVTRWRGGLGPGASVSLLFEGPDGTGKATAAAVLAREIGVPLVRLDANGLVGGPAVYLVDLDVSDEERRRIVRALPVWRARVASTGLLVASTSHRALLDYARFDEVLTFRLPRADQVPGLIAGRLGTMVSGLDWAPIVAAADGLSHADLVAAAEDAAAAVLHRDGVRLTSDDLVMALMARRV
jgi:AAA+ superfamily predicted ATPase